MKQEILFYMVAVDLGLLGILLATKIIWIIDDWFSVKEDRKDRK